MHSLRAPALALLLPIALQAQTSWWQQAVVLPPDSSVAIDVREAIDYKPVSPSALRMDVYRPHNPPGLLPGVIFVHGGPIPPNLPVEPRQISQYTSLGRLVASHGLVGVVFSHRLTSAGAIDTAASDVRDAVRYVVDNAVSLGIDESRLCIWSISAGGAVLGPAFREFAGHIRCLVSYYNIFSPSVLQTLVGSPSPTTPVSPALIDLVGGGTVALPPTLLVRAGQDNPKLNEDIDRFVARALEHGAQLELHAYADGRHGFDVHESDASRRLLLRTIAFLHASMVER